MCQRSESSNSRGFGMSAALPIGAPASTHFAIVWISSSRSARIVLEALDAHVGIDPPRRHLPLGDAA
jgi:hypothetical protein